MMTTRAVWLGASLIIMIVAAAVTYRVAARRKRTREQRSCMPYRPVVSGPCRRRGSARVGYGHLRAVR